VRLDWFINLLGALNVICYMTKFGSNVYLVNIRKRIIQLLNKGRIIVDTVSCMQWEFIIFHVVFLFTVSFS
jgi:hypothetical protein